MPETQPPVVTQHKAESNAVNKVWHESYGATTVTQPQVSFLLKTLYKSGAVDNWKSRKKLLNLISFIDHLGL